MRYKVCYGGRGAGKSVAIAQILVILGAQKKLRILCTREVQNSIRHSVHKLLTDCIGKYSLDFFYKITREGIYGTNGTEFLFHGLQHNPDTIKSLEGVDICWCEESQKISDASWETLLPTIRKDGSEIWLSMNPYEPTDPTSKRFLTPPFRKNQLNIKVNYDSNKFFPNVLREEMEYQKELDYKDYLHIWEGEFRTATEAQIFKNKVIVEDFESPTDVIYYFGLDFGFSQDPTAIIRCFVKNDKDNHPHLYIDYEAGGLGVELDYTHRLIDKIPNSKRSVIRADSSRPESISYIRRQGYNIESVYKWAGSVEDGIAYIKSFKKIHVHNRCMSTAEEFVKYSYKVDRLTGDIQTQIIDKHNHYVDALRYSLQPLIKQRPGIGTMDVVGY